MDARRHRLILRSRTGGLVPAPASARGHGRDARRPAVLRPALLALAVWAALPACGAGPLPSGTLPVSVVPIAPGANIAASGTATATIGNRVLTIDQATHRAIIDWQSFNIAADAAVRFQQPDNTAAVLNRIHSADPSVIQGRLSANGDVYLVNSNGIVFGTGSQVDVGGLLASTLGMTANLFNAGVLTNPDPSKIPALSADGATAGAVVIETGARISAASGGRLLFAGKDITNAGTLSAPQGQVVLAAGTKVYLAASQDPQLRGLLVEVDNGGTATNAAGASITADRGNVSIVGLAVNQGGRISASSSVSLNGSVRLVARDTVAPVPVAGVATPTGSRYGRLTLASGSRIDVRPDTTDTTEIPDSTRVNAGRVELAGSTVHVQGASGTLAAASVVVPAGTITVSAQKGLDFAAISGSPAAGVRVLIDDGAVLDVSGLDGVAAPMSRHQLVVELRGNELRDAPLLRNSPLRGKTVYVDARTGTTLADVGGYVTQIRRTLAERSVAGGSIRLQSEGDVVVRDGATLDVSGGSIDYAAGTLRVSRLVTAAGRIVGITDASPEQLYAGIATEFTAAGGRSAANADLRQFDGYVQGGSAGSIAVLAPAAVVDGTLRGSVVAGPWQTAAGAVPLGGELILGGSALVQPLAYHPAAETAEALTVRVAGVTFDRARQPLAGGLAIDAALPGAFAAATSIDPQALTAAGFNRIAVDANGTVRIVRGSALALRAGSLDTDAGRRTAGVTLAGRKVEIDGDVVVPAGSIRLASQLTVPITTTLSDYGVRVGAGVTLAARGLWTNDGPLSPTRGQPAPVLKDGGVVTIASVGDVVLETGSLLDVTAGGAIGTTGTLAGGRGGDITVSTGRVGLPEGVVQASSLTLGGTLRGHGFTGGGTLTLQTSLVTLGSRRTNDARELVLAPAFFTEGGFGAYTIGGHDGLAVTAGTGIAPRTATLHATAAARFAGSADDVYAAASGLPVVTVATDAIGVRPAADLALSAGSTAFGDLTVAAGARVETDPGGAIRLEAGRQLTLAGALVAPGGSVDLAISFDRDLAPLYQYLPGQSIWLAAGSRIDTRGVLVPAVAQNGLRQGEVLDGGAVTVSAGRGYVIAQSGASIDVSGTAATLDVRAAVGARTVVQATAVASAAGSVTLEAREGILFDGALAAQAGGVGARGGVLAWTLLPAVIGNPAFLATPERTIVVAPGGGVVPAGLTPGAAVDPTWLTAPTLNHLAFVRPDVVRASGADSLRLATPDAVRFDGAVTLALARDFTIDARVIRGSAGAVVDVTAGHVGLASTSGLAAIGSTAGTATVALRGDAVDVSGTVTLSGFSTATLASAGDLQLAGWYDQSRTLPADTLPTLAGVLTSTGTLRLGAARVFPTSASDFTVRALGNGSRVELFRTAASDAPLLSAGGSLTVRADTIVNGTTLAAPFGSITLEAGSTLTLAAGSETRIDGGDLAVPFGMTRQSGREWIYLLDADANVSLVFAAPPKREVVLRGPVIDVQAGARIDASGGGDLSAYEFTPGPGGSTDILAAGRGSFALVPTQAIAWAPYDFQEYASGADTGVRPGARITFQGAGLVADGTYTLLPARYALMPGAVLVTPVAGTYRLGADATQTLADGSVIASGRLAYATAGGGTVADAAFGRYRIQTGSMVRARAEYQETSATPFFADATGQRPVDAARVEISPTASLSLAGTLVARAGTGGRGGLIDITAERMVVDDRAGSDADGVHLSAAMLGAIRADSLLLGGRREIRNGITWLVPVATSVTVTGAGGTLAGSDIVLAARDAVTFAADARVEAIATSATPGDLRVAANADGTMARGAFARIGGGDVAALVRDGTVVTNAAGRVAVADGAMLEGGAVQLDATGSVAIADGATLRAAQFAFGASRVTVGTATAGTPGLVLDGAALAAVSTAARVVLRSDSTLDFVGGVTLAPRHADATGTHAGRLDLAAGTLRFLGTGAVTLQASRLTFTNATGVASATATGGTVTLAVEADDVVLGAGGKTLSGLAGSTWTVAREITFDGAGSLTTVGPTTIEARGLTATAGATQALTVTGATLAVRRHAGAADAELPGVQDAPAAALALEGAGLVFDGAADLRSGSLTLASTGTGPLTVGGAARIAVGGLSHAFGTTTVVTDGGSVTLAAAAGDVAVLAGARIDVGAAAGGKAGTLRVTAPGGTIALDGTLLAHAAAPGAGGHFVADAGRLADFGALEAVLAAGGFDAERRLRVRTGDLAVAAGTAVTARDIALSADTGSVTLAGRLDASGTKAGGIAVYAGGSLTVAGTATLQAVATGAGEPGGSVALGSGDAGALSLAGGSVIDVSSAGSGTGGQVILRAARTADGQDLRIGAAGATITGATEVALEGVKVYANVQTLDATGTGSGGRLGLATVLADSAAYAARRDAVLARLGLAPLAGIALRPGVEVRSTGNLTLTSDWNLAASGTSAAGHLTLRAAGNVTLQRSLSDGFVTVPDDPAYPGGLFGQATDWQLTDQASWSYRITAGADLAAADPMAMRALAALTQAGNGDLVVNGLVRTGTGTIDLAAGRDFRLARSGANVYTAGRSDPTATLAMSQFFIASEFTDQAVGAGLEALNSLIVESPVFLMQGGRVSVTAQRDAIGHDSGQVVADWLYTRTLSVSGASATGALNATDGFGSAGAIAAGILNPQTGWWPRIRVFNQGLGALGGGSVSVRAGRDVIDLSAAVATSGRVEGAAGAAPTAADLTITGGGDLAIQAGRDIVRGVYYVARGDGDLAAGRDVTAGTGTAGMALALGDAVVRVTAGRALALETAFNPTLVAQPDWSRIDPNYLTNDAVELARFSTYSGRSAVDLRALTGDLQLRSTGSALAARDPLLFGSGSDGLYLFPGTVRAAALLGDVTLNAPLALAPAASGNLELLAGGDVTSLRNTIDMVENAGNRLPSVLAPATGFSMTTLIETDQPGSAANFLLHSDPPLHADDPAPARIIARTGSIVATGSILTLPKAAEIEAGSDVLDLSYVGQNVRAGDVTRIHAGRDVLFRALPRASGALQPNTNSIQLGGPGLLEVIAGRDLDLGLSKGGITTRGNLDNPFLPETGAGVVIGAGFGGVVGGAAAPDYRGFWVETQVDRFAATLTDLPADERAARIAQQRAAVAATFDATATGDREARARDLFFEELRLSGRAAVADRDYSRGERAIARLFDAVNATPERHSGDINVFFSKIRTEAGGDIRLFAPGGAVNAGLATTSGLTGGSIDASQLGIVTVDGGSIQAYTRYDFLVNASRVFTLGGGDILIWSAEGNIDAGKGAKTAASTPPPQLVVDRDGRFVLDITQSIQGSGIGVLLAREGVKPGDVDLIAPRGEVNAGDAGIAVAGNLTIAAERVIGADNIKVGGVSVGVPAVAAAAPGGGLTNTTTAADATRTTERVSQLAGGGAGEVAKPVKLSFLTVEVLGFGGRKEEDKR